MSPLAENIKVLLWMSKGGSSQKSYREYIDYVATRCGMTPDRFRAILRDRAKITDQEVAALRLFFEDYSDNLSALEYTYLFSDLVACSGEDIREKNLRYLLESLEYGENAKFVAAMDVNPSTLTRWKQGKTKPDRYAQAQIAKYFGLKDVEDLKHQFLFLELEPVSTQQKKQYCTKLIDIMDKNSFEAIFAALEKILS